MADVDALREVSNARTVKITWETLTTTNRTGEAVQAGRWADKTVQAVGTFGASAAVTMQGSNDGGDTWGTLHDPQGSAVTINSSGVLVVIAESPELIRPSLANGDGSTDVDVIIVCVERGV